MTGTVQHNESDHTRGGVGVDTLVPLSLQQTVGTCVCCLLTACLMLHKQKCTHVYQCHRTLGQPATQLQVPRQQNDVTQ